MADLSFRIESAELLDSLVQQTLDDYPFPELHTWWYHQAQKLAYAAKDVLAEVREHELLLPVLEAAEQLEQRWLEFALPDDPDEELSNLHKAFAAFRAAKEEQR